MKVSAVEWDDANRHHLFVENAERNISEEEIDEILYQTFSPSRMSQEMRTRDQIRRIVWGRTTEDRYLSVVIAPGADGVVRPVTAWEMSDDELSTYESWRRTVKA